MEKHFKYSMGLDIGIASVGWAVINLDKNRIEDLGVRVFEKAERPKDGGPINEKRRTARGLRRRLKRKRVRMNKIKELFVEYNLVSKNELENLYLLSTNDKDIWTLRAEGLDRRLDNKEWARVLTAIAKRRGFRSNRKSLEENDKESGKLLKSTKENKKYMQLKGYRTIGEMFAKDEKYQGNKRNKGGNYFNCVLREDLKEEIKILFESQRKFDNQFASEDFENEYLQVFEYQKPFMTKLLMKKMIGKCTFEKDEPRIAKNTWTFERFMLLQKVNNFKYSVNGTTLSLKPEEKERVIELAYSQKSGVDFNRIRKEFNLPDDARFVGLDYYVRKKKNKVTGEYEPEKTLEEVIKTVEKAKVVQLKGFHDIKTAYKNAEAEQEFEDLIKNIEKFDEIANILTLNKTDISMIKELKTLNLDSKVIEELIKLDFVKFGHLSYKAISKILPHLEEGKLYNEACELAGYEFRNLEGEPQYKLPVIHKEEIRNPVVLRSVTQTRKVINAIIDKYGSPFEIHIEVARDLAKSFKERMDIQKKQDANKTSNELLKQDIQEHFNKTAKPVDMLKVKLYHEQEGKCAYSLETLDYERLLEPGYVEIDHAIPFSRSFDDSYNNKVLIKTRENQNKRNRTPYEYLTTNGKWEVFEGWVKSTYKNNPRKRENLLVKNFNEDKEKDWIARNINDTKYIAKFMSNYIKKNLIFDNFEENENRIKVKTIEGALTTALRHYWGIASKSRENDLHHAEDAVIIACATEKFQRKIREYSKQKELYYPNKNGEYFDPETGEIVDVKYKAHEMVRPWEMFKEELEARMSTKPVEWIKTEKITSYNDIENLEETIRPIFVSRMPNRKVNGQAHEETIYSIKHKEKGFVTIKRELSKISKAEIEMITNSDDCKELYQSNKDMYDRIFERMKLFNFKADKAFTDDFVLRRKSLKGEGPVIKSVKVPVIMKAGVKVEKGLAANGGMVRVDVFEKNGKNYLVPIYVAEMIEKELPNKAIVANKLESEWLVIDESYNFRFSLYSNDLVIIKKKGKEIIIGYYASTHRGTGAINLIAHDNSERYESIGVQSLETFDKYEVDILGNYHKVKKEVRKGGKKRTK